MAKIKVSSTVEVVSNLSMIPNPDVDGGLKRAYLYDVEVYQKEVKTENADGSLNPSMYAGIERPYLAFYFKEILDKSLNPRDRVYIHRIFPVDNTTSKGKELTFDNQVDSLQGIINEVIHIWNGVAKSALAIHKRKFEDFEIDPEEVLTSDGVARAAAFTELFTNIVNQFKGDKPIFESAKGEYKVPVWIKLVLDWKNEDYAFPQYIRKGFIEPMAYNAKALIPSQLSIDLVKGEKIVRPEAKAEPREAQSKDVAASIKSDLGLNV